ncbi:sensor histidine kinase [Pseudolysinimonas yzui]|uniref:Sensor-like histidine kinase SenX3 n=1 Tax=Pseudolysinimonas yzui TaxID=2708254 RepID=A0A8J3GRL8_9MICO|nr:ATP-binding protein [Pseudolysinimonas yzui]GHF19768.1 two-component sensor histidine kinase [Pseudolysinimonas yzui]
MDQAWLVPVAIAFGFLLGAGSAAAIVAAHRRGQRAVAVVTPTVPEGADEVIDSLESAGIVLDASNNVLKASTGALAFGLVWNQALMHPELVALVDQVRRDGEPIGKELHLSRGPFGEASIYVFVRVARLGTRFVLVLAEDRTESYRLEEVRRDFVANVSHELKTPIGAVSLLAEALEQASNEPDEVKRFAKRLSIEAERLARTTHEIIELSRLQASDVLQEAAVVDIDAVIAQAVDRNRVAAEKHGIALVSGGDAGTEVFGDAGMLVTAVHNLVANAIQYSPDNSRVGIGVSHADGVVEIAVTDQGVGIPEAERERVFERFFRVDSARSRNTGGTGLGLAIVKHVVQNHGGDVRVWSHAGSGSTFTIRLPEAVNTPAVATTLGATT